MCTFSPSPSCFYSVVKCRSSHSPPIPPPTKPPTPSPIMLRTAPSTPPPTMLSRTPPSLFVTSNFITSDTFSTYASLCVSQRHQILHERRLQPSSGCTCNNVNTTSNSSTSFVAVHISSSYAVLATTTICLSATLMVVHRCVCVNTCTKRVPQIFSLFFIVSCRIIYFINKGLLSSCHG